MSQPEPAVRRNAAPPDDDRPTLSLSLDLDNQWSYMKTHGDPGWEDLPSYFDRLVPRFLAPLAARGLRLTIFVVGQDAALERNREPLRALAEAGHEIGNHSFRHEPWLHLYTRAELDDELARAEEAIEAATGRLPRGFRGPGFSLSADTLEALALRGYRYDASTFPTFLGPLARAYYFWKSRDLSPEERRKRGRLFGTLRDGLQPLHGHVWRLERAEIVEIPVTTMPLFRAPFHLSYLLYLARRSRAAALAYLRSALALCRLGGIEPSFLLHPLDFLGGDDVTGLAFFPGMDLSTAFKLDFFDSVLDVLVRDHAVVTLDEHARLIRERGRAAVRSPEVLRP